MHTTSTGSKSYSTLIDIGLQFMVLSTRFDDFLTILGHKVPREKSDFVDLCAKLEHVPASPPRSPLSGIFRSGHTISTDTPFVKNLLTRDSFRMGGNNGMKVSI